MGRVRLRPSTLLHFSPLFESAITNDALLTSEEQEILQDVKLVGDHRLEKKRTGQTICDVTHRFSEELVGWLNIGKSWFYPILLTQNCAECGSLAAGGTQPIFFRLV